MENNFEIIKDFSDLIEKNNTIKYGLYDKYNVKRGLRNKDGSGVLVGLTNIGDVHSYIIDEGEIVPVEGRLMFRGIDVKDLVNGAEQEKRFGFEECCFLLLFGELPSREQLDQFKELLTEARNLPSHFTEDVILKTPSPNIMNKLAMSVLSFYSYDPSPDSLEISNLVRQSIELIARLPLVASYSYQAKNHYFENGSLHIHYSQADLCTAENILRMIRSDSKHTQTEAEMLDLMLILHAEHGGGNNSSFATHVVSSTGTDTYSTIAAAIGSLKGPLHGGANAKVLDMVEDIKANVNDWADADEVAAYLEKILKREAFDRQGLIYGMGHAVYTLSDPRAVLIKQKAAQLASEKGMEKEFELYNLIEELTPGVFYNVKKVNKIMCANVDLYSGFVYKMLNIPFELHTPLFAVGRIAGWCAHRIEEVMSGGRIIRPAYKNVCPKKKYIPLSERCKNPGA